MRRAAAIVVSALAACGPSAATTGQTEPMGSSAIGSSEVATASASTDLAPTGEPTTTSTTSTTSPTSTTSTTATTTGTSDDSGTTMGPPLVLCEGHPYGCGDGVDNDGDGLTDLSDPECTSPCDDLEDSLHDGIPWGRSCREGCYFDAETGNNGDCVVNLKCDPLEPALTSGCEYTAAPQCADEWLEVPQACLDSCLPVTPNGCDCFGCCHVATDQGTIDIYLRGTPECRLDNLGGCSQCTYHGECENPCEPAACELCFGEQALPPGCDVAGCPEGVEPCVDARGVASCAPGMYCVTGCCAPLGG